MILIPAVTALWQKLTGGCPDTRVLMRGSDRMPS